HELARDADQALLFGVNPDLSRHFVKNFSLTGRRPEGRIRLKGQFDEVAAFARVLKNERIRNHLQERTALFCIFSAGLFELALLLWVMREPQDTFGLAALFAGAQRPSRNRDQAVKGPRLG